MACFFRLCSPSHEITREEHVFPPFSYVYHRLAHLLHSPWAACTSLRTQSASGFLFLFERPRNHHFRAQRMRSCEIGKRLITNMRQRPSCGLTLRQTAHNACSKKTLRNPTPWDLPWTGNRQQRGSLCLLRWSRYPQKVVFVGFLACCKAVSRHRVHGDAGSAREDDPALGHSLLECFLVEPGTATLTLRRGAGGCACLVYNCLTDAPAAAASTNHGVVVV